MKKDEVRIGETYAVKVSGSLAPVRVLGPCSYGGWYGRNEWTGRQVRVRSAARLRRPWRVTDMLARLGQTAGVEAGEEVR